MTYSAKIWVVEMLDDRTNRWIPTVRACLSRAEAREAQKEWEKHNPWDDFRVRCYRA